MKKYIWMSVLLPGIAMATENSPVLLAPLIRIDGAVITYVGALNEFGTRSVVDLIKTGSYKELHIDSRGGEIISAMEFGNAVFDYGMDVLVTNLCLSSCANYIFPAGRSKKISDGAFVMWHGDARQRNFLEEQQQLELRVTETGVGALTFQEKKKLDYSQTAVKTQDAFYKKIGIDGSIARIGQEIDKPVSLWAMPTRDMEAFGIRNIDAPENYGTYEYCRTKEREHVFGRNITCLLLKPEYITEWRMGQVP